MLGWQGDVLPVDGVGLHIAGLEAESLPLVEELFVYGLAVAGPGPAWEFPIDL
jgi:hypothetical protein